MANSLVSADRPARQYHVKVYRQSDGLLLDEIWTVVTPAGIYPWVVENAKNYTVETHSTFQSTGR